MSQVQPSSSPRNNPLEVHYVAQGFYLAGRRCIVDVQIAPGVVQNPYMQSAVNFAFAAELFMKSLLLLRLNKRMRTHDLQKLFDALPQQDQEGLKAFYSQLPAGYDMQADIEETKDYFEDLRYWYESTRWHYDPNAADRFATTLYHYSAKIHGKELLVDESKL